MKKKLLLFVAILSMIFMTGCFDKKQEENPKENYEENVETLETAIENLNDIKSIEILSTLNLKVNQDDTKVELNIPFTIAGNENEDNLLMKLSLGENSLLKSMEAYVSVNKKDENVEMYIPSTIIDMIFGLELEETEWLYVNLNDLTGESISINEDVLNEYKNIDYKKVIGKNFVYVDSDEGVNHYKLIINDELIKRLPLETAIKEVLDVVDDAKVSAAKSGASMVVFGVNNYCAAADMREQLSGETNICKDGVTIEEVGEIVDLEDIKVNSITFDGKVTELEIESNKITIIYDNGEYIVSKNESEGFGVEIKLDVYIDTKDYNFTKIAFDLSELTMENGEKIEEIEMFEQFKFTIEFKNINNTVITIPEDIKNNNITIDTYVNNLENLLEY